MSTENQVIVRLRDGELEVEACPEYLTVILKDYDCPTDDETVHNDEYGEFVVMQLEVE